MKRAVKLLLKTILSVLIFLALYFSLAYILSRIPVEKEQATNADISIYILSNGVHTDIVVPTKNDLFNWHELVKPEHTLSQDSTAGLLAFGWGDKGFYLETPTWNDLKFSTAFKAAFGLSSSAIHATYYHHLTPGEQCKEILISKEQYLKLIAYITQSFLSDKTKSVINISTKAVYGNNDAFYEAVGSYSLFKTCNTWTNSALKHCGQKACVWTPFEGGIFYQYQ
jgi:uncharacterized protein (TIGR02117 family)